MKCKRTTFITLPLKTSPFAFRTEVKILLVRTFPESEKAIQSSRLLPNTTTSKEVLLTFSIVISLMCTTNALAWTFKPLPSFSSSEHRVRQTHQYFTLIRKRTAKNNIRVPQIRAGLNTKEKNTFKCFGIKLNFLPIFKTNLQASFQRKKNSFQGNLIFRSLGGEK